MVRFPRGETQRLVAAMFGEYGDPVDGEASMPGHRAKRNLVNRLLEGRQASTRTCDTNPGPRRDLPIPSHPEVTEE